MASQVSRDELLCPVCSQPIEMWNDDIEFSMDLHLQSHKSLDKINHEHGSYMENLKSRVLPTNKNGGNPSSGNNSIRKEFEDMLRNLETQSKPNPLLEKNYNIQISNLSEVFSSLPPELKSHWGFISENKGTADCNVCKKTLKPITKLFEHLKTNLHEETIIKYFTNTLPIELCHIMEFVSFNFSNLSCNLCRFNFKMSPNNPNETIISIIMHNNSEEHLKNKSINGLGRSDTASAGLTTTSYLYQVIHDNQHFLAFREPEFLCRLCNVVIGCNLNQMSYQSLVAHFINEAHFSKASSELAAYVALHFGGSQRHEFNVSNNNIYCLICKCFVGQNMEEILSHVKQLPTYQLTNPFSTVNVEEGRPFREATGNKLPSSVSKMESQETKSDTLENTHELFPKKRKKKQGNNRKKQGNNIKLISIRPINNDDHNVPLPGINYKENANQCSQSSTRNTNGGDQSSSFERKENVFPESVGNKFLSALESAVSKKKSQENKSGTQEDIYEFLVSRNKKKKEHQNIHVQEKVTIKLSNVLEMLKNLQEHLEESENRCTTKKAMNSQSEILNEVLAKIRKTHGLRSKLKQFFIVYRGEMYCTLCYVPLSKDKQGSNLIEIKILSHLEESEHKSQMSTYSTKLIVIRSIKVLIESIPRIKEDIKPCFLEGLFACTLCNCLTNYDTVMLHLRDINHIQRKALQVESISYQRKANGLEAAKLLPKAMCIKPLERKTPSECKTEDLKAVKCLMENMIDIRLTEFKIRPDANQNKDKNQKPVQNIGLSTMSSLLSKIEKKVPW